MSILESPSARRNSIFGAYFFKNVFCKAATLGDIIGVPACIFDTCNGIVCFVEDFCKTTCFVRAFIETIADYVAREAFVVARYCTSKRSFMRTLLEFGSFEGTLCHVEQTSAIAQTPL